jgi:hypothetical protein
MVGDRVITPLILEPVSLWFALFLGDLHKLKIDIPYFKIDCGNQVLVVSV